MKKFLVILLFVGVAQFCLAQNTQRVVVYDSPDKTEWHTETIQSDNVVTNVTPYILDTLGIYPSYQTDRNIYHKGQEVDSVSNATYEYLRSLKSMFKNSEPFQEKLDE